MSVQIAVRLPDDIVTFLDQRVAAGDAPSRAALVARALERERRRIMAEHDARIYATTPDDPDMAAMAEWASKQPMDID